MAQRSRPLEHSSLPPREAGTPTEIRDLSVIVCTLNRSSLLRKCLSSLENQEKDRYTFETIVVDNGSTDNTKEVVESFRSHPGNLHYVYEPQPGLACARQTGFEASIGRYVAYIDDDAMAAPHWCSAIFETFEQTKRSPTDRIAALGGPIEPIFEIARPAWLEGELTTLYAIVDRGNVQHTFPGSGCPIGANMAFVRAVLVENPWDVTLAMCEEISLFARLRGRGFEFLYVPGMRVQHFISAKRLTPGWLLGRYYADGMAQKHLPVGTVRRIRLAVGAFVKIPVLLLLSMFGSEGRKLKFRCKLRFHRGFVTALLTGGDLNSVEYLSTRRNAAS